jgi:hypothetical protein
MTETLKYWIEQSEHECDKPSPIGSCLACDMLQLERELTAVTEQRDRLAEALQEIRSGYGGQVTDPDCNCGDCEFLIKIDEALQSLTMKHND